jgi:hypothetical protein
MDVPYPSEYRLVPRRRRPRAFFLALAVAVVSLTLAVSWPHAQRHAEAPARPVAVVHHQPAPKSAAVTLMVGKVSYACTVVVKPKPRRR